MKVLAPLAESGKINPDASIRDSQSAIINAPIDVVWKALIDLEKWPEWNGNIKSVKIDKVEEGAQFKWNINGNSVSSTIRRIKAPELLSWTGNAMGIKAIHVWKLEEASDNQTIISTEESLQGILTLFFSHQKLHDTLLNWLECLKQHVEKPA